MPALQLPEHFTPSLLTYFCYLPSSSFPSHSYEEPTLPTSSSRLWHSLVIHFPHSLAFLVIKFLQSHKRNVAIYSLVSSFSFSTSPIPPNHYLFRFSHLLPSSLHFTAGFPVLPFLQCSTFLGVYVLSLLLWRFFCLFFLFKHRHCVSSSSSTTTISSFGYSLSFSFL